MPRGDRRKYKNRRLLKMEMPEEFTSETMNTINRIEMNANVVGVLYFKDDTAKMYTMSGAEEIILMKRLPAFNELVRNAVKEVDITDELVAYRILSKSKELLVVADTDFSVCVLQNTG